MQSKQSEGKIVELSREQWFTIHNTLIDADDWCESGWGQFNTLPAAYTRLESLRTDERHYEFRIVRHTHIEELVPNNL